MPLGSSRFGLSGAGLPDLDVEYLVIAGGGSGGNGGNKCAGGGGAGGYRSSCTDDTYSGELQSVETPLTLEKDTAYSVTIGAGGTGGNSAGNTSTFHTISSTGGGHGYSRSGGSSIGGSGGGTAGTTARAGTPNQGFAGGRGDYSNYRAGGGGGAGEVGADMYGTYDAVAGGDGIQSSITGTAVYRGGGGGSSRNYADPTDPGGSVRGYGQGPGGAGGGGTGSENNNGTAGTANTGGGGGGSDTGTGKSGGSGVVILRYPKEYTATTNGLTAGTETTTGDLKYIEITAGISGTVTWSA